MYVVSKSSLNLCIQVDTIKTVIRKRIFRNVYFRKYAHDIIIDCSESI